MTLDHSHSPEAISARLSQVRGSGYLKDMIYGAIDGTVTTFAIVAGVEGAGLSHGVVVVLGIANILADGFSMAASNYSGTKAELDDRKRIVQIEEHHITNHRTGEVEELRQILERRGLSGQVLSLATDEITRKKDKWIALMLTDEYGLTLDAPRPLRAAIATFGAFLLVGTAPLLPFIVGLPNPFTISVIATMLTFFMIGAAKSFWSLARWWWSGGETLVIGTVAALIAYGVGSLFAMG